MRFSFVIPCYNAQKYIEECIESILAQTFGDFEIVAVNDGSSDDTLSILEEYQKKDSRIRVISQKNKGQAAARNVGIKECAGEYLVCLDSDDLISDFDFLNILDKKIEENNADIVLYKFSKFWKDDYSDAACTFNFPKNGSLAIIDLVRNDAFYCSAWSKVIRRSFLVDNNIYFAEGNKSEDQDWFLTVMSHKPKLNCIDKSFILYRQHENSVTSSGGEKNICDALETIEKWKSLYEHSSDSDNDMLHALAKLYCNLLIASANTGTYKNKEIYLRLKNLKVLLRYDANKRVSIFKTINKFFGFRLLFTLIDLILKVR